MVNDMTRGNSFKQIIIFSLPVMIGSILQQLFSLIDAYIVGQTLGNSALASVGVTGSITFLIIGFISGMAEGSCLLVARYFGAGDKKSFNRCIGNIIYVSAALVAVLTVIALVLNEPILRLIDTPPDIIDGAVEYLTPIYAGMFATLMYNLLAGILRAMGDSRSPLYFLTVSSIFNIVLDYLFIVPLKMGIAGAAYATVISQLISAVLCLVYIGKKHLIKFCRNDLRPNGRMMSQICLMGLPAALQYSVTAVGSVITQAATNFLGSAAVTAVSVSNRVLSLNWAVLNSFGIALSNFSGQNVGAGNIHRLRKGLFSTFIICSSYCALATIVFYFFGTSASALFLDEKTPEIIELIDVFVKVQALFMMFLGLIAVFRNCAQGMGFSIQAMFAGLLELIGRTGISVIFVGSFGFSAITYASPVAWILADLFLVPLCFYAIRKLSKLHPDWLLKKE